MTGPELVFCLAASSLVFVTVEIDKAFRRRRPMVAPAAGR